MRGEYFFNEPVHCLKFALTFSLQNKTKNAAIQKLENRRTILLSGVYIAAENDPSVRDIVITGL